MSAFSPLMSQLIEALRVLPGVGPKSAQRMALHLLERDRQSALQLSQALTAAANKIGRCEQCRTLTEFRLCPVCAHPAREQSQLCVVESPADQFVIEQTASYKGLYFVLMGHLSPLDGIGPEELGLDILAARCASGEIKELILATNPTVEGEATAHYIAELARKHNVLTTRIAHGVPLGGELEYIDGGTLAHAFSGRQAF